MIEPIDIEEAEELVEFWQGILALTNEGDWDGAYDDIVAAELGDSHEFINWAERVSHMSEELRLLETDFNAMIKEAKGYVEDEVAEAAEILRLRKLDRKICK